MLNTLLKLHLQLPLQLEPQTGYIPSFILEGGWKKRRHEFYFSPNNLFYGSHIRVILGSVRVTAGHHHIPSPPGQLPMPSGRNVVSTSHKVSLLPSCYCKACLFHCCSLFPPLHFLFPPIIYS